MFILVRWFPQTLKPAEFTAMAAAANISLPLPAFRLAMARQTRWIGYIYPFSQHPNRLVKVRHRFITRFLQSYPGNLVVFVITVFLKTIDLRKTKLLLF